MRKPRADAVLLNLPEEQQAQIAEWLLDGMPYHRAREAVKKEFGVEVSVGSFAGFWEVVCAPALIERRAKLVAAADTAATEALRTPGHFDHATIDAIKQRAFELAINPRSEPRTVRDIFSLIIQARDQEIASERLALEQSKFEENLARRKAAIEAELGRAKAAGGLTQETIDKIQAELKLL